jgi:hypothetical protein
MMSGLHLPNLSTVSDSTLSLQLFKRFCLEMGAEYELFMYYIEVCWFSKGQVSGFLIELGASNFRFFFVGGGGVAAGRKSQYQYHLTGWVGLFLRMREICSDSFKIDTWIRVPFFADMAPVIST